VFKINKVVPTESTLLENIFLGPFFDDFPKDSSLQEILVFSLCTVHFRDNIPILFPNDILFYVGHFSDFDEVGLSFRWRKLQIPVAFSDSDVLIKRLGVFELRV
jgi:hypothetical protein